MLNCQLIYWLISSFQICSEKSVKFQWWILHYLSRSLAFSPLLCILSEFFSGDISDFVRHWFSWHDFGSSKCVLYLLMYKNVRKPIYMKQEFFSFSFQVTRMNVYVHLLWVRQVELLITANEKEFPCNLSPLIYSLVSHNRQRRNLQNNAHMHITVSFP